MTDPTTAGAVAVTQADVDRAHAFLRGLRRPTINSNVPAGVAVEAMFRWHQQETERERETANLAGVAHAEAAGEMGVHPSGDSGDSRAILGSSSTGTDGRGRAGTLEVVARRWRCVSDTPPVGGTYLIGGYVEVGGLRYFARTFASCIRTLDGPESAHRDGKLHIPISWWFDTGPHPEAAAPPEAPAVEDATYLRTVDDGLGNDWFGAANGDNS